jgi:hypothetical protein
MFSFFQRFAASLAAAAQTGVIVATSNQHRGMGMPLSVGTPLAAWKGSRRGSILQRGLPGRSKSRTRGPFSGEPTHCIDSGDANSLSCFVRRSKHVHRSCCNPLAICRDVGHATHGAHGVQRTSSPTHSKSVTNWPGGRFESGGFTLRIEKRTRSQRQEL